MKTIFLLTNFTEVSSRALKNFMRVYGATLKNIYQFKLINAWRQPRTGRFQMINLDEYLAENSLIDLKKEKKGLTELFVSDPPAIEMLSLKGDIVVIVNQLAEKDHPDLIVMGTKGSNMIREIIVGSTTGRIIRQIKLPTFIIPESVTVLNPDRVVFASDLQECRTSGDFEKITDLVRKFMAELLILHIYKEEKPEVDHFEHCMKKYLDGINYSFHYKQHINVEDGISMFVNHMKAGLLTLVGKKDDLIVKLFKQSITNEMTQRAELPLLIIHE